MAQPCGTEKQKKMFLPVTGLHPGSGNDRTMPYPAMPVAVWLHISLG